MSSEREMCVCASDDLMRVHPATDVAGLDSSIHTSYPPLCSTHICHRRCHYLCYFRPGSCCRRCEQASSCTIRSSPTSHSARAPHKGTGPQLQLLALAAAAGSHSAASPPMRRSRWGSRWGRSARWWWEAAAAGPAPQRCWPSASRAMHCWLSVSLAILTWLRLRRPALTTRQCLAHLPEGRCFSSSGMTGAAGPDHYSARRCLAHLPEGRCSLQR